MLAAERLRADGALARAVAAGATVFAVCAGFQIIGTSFPDAAGMMHEGLGLLDVITTKGTASRCVGEVAVDPDPSLGLARLSGFENHSGVSSLGDATALGVVVAGRAGEESRSRRSLARLGDGSADRDGCRRRG